MLLKQQNIMSEELTTIDNSSVPAVYDGIDTGMGDHRIKTTNLVLIQNTTRERQGGKPGQILDAKTGEVFDSVPVVVLKVFKNRVMFPPGEIDLDAKPICRSSDGIVPSPFAVQPQARTCARCPYSQWNNGKKPPCQQKTKLLVVKATERVPRYITLGGKSISVVNDLIDRLFEDIQVNKAKKIQVTQFDYIFDLSAEEVKSKTGIYYIARFSKIRRVPTLGEYLPEYQKYAVYTKHEEEDEEAIGSEQQVDSVVEKLIQPEVIEAA